MCRGKDEKRKTFHRVKTRKKHRKLVGNLGKFPRVNTFKKRGENRAKTAKKQSEIYPKKQRAKIALLKNKYRIYRVVDLITLPSKS